MRHKDLLARFTVHQQKKLRDWCYFFQSNFKQDIIILKRVNSVIFECGSQLNCLERNMIRNLYNIMYVLIQNLLFSGLVEYIVRDRNKCLSWYKQGKEQLTQIYTSYEHIHSALMTETMYIELSWYNLPMVKYYI